MASTSHCLHGSLQQVSPHPTISHTPSTERTRKENQWRIFHSHLVPPLKSPTITALVFPERRQEGPRTLLGLFSSLVCPLFSPGGYRLQASMEGGDLPNACESFSQRDPPPLSVRPPPPPLNVCGVVAYAIRSQPGHNLGAAEHT